MLKSQGEMVELYWEALTRDVPFNAFQTNSLTIAAANELSTLSDFKGPKIDGMVTPQNFIFREESHGDRFLVPAYKSDGGLFTRL